MNAIGYIRISKKDQSTHSLEYQEKSIRDYCDRNDLELGSLFIDDGESSYTFDRPDYKALESFIKKNKKTVRYLVVFDHDRFSRNLPEALQKIEFLEKKHDLKVIATSEPINIDTSDPSVFLLRAFKYLIANQELMTIRKRAKVSARHAQESGRYINKAPFAYINAKDASGKMVIQINEPDRFIVEKIYRDYLNDVPHFIIHKEVKQLGFPHTATSSVFRILNNPLYCGLVRVCAHGKHPEKLVKGIHEAIIPEHLYYSAQEKLKRNKRKMIAKPKEQYPLKGVIKSPCCGRDLTAGWSTGKKKKYLYYRCLDHSNVNISGIELHDKFDELLRYLSFTQDFVNEVVSEVSKKVNTYLKSTAQRQQEIRMQLLAVDKKIENADDKLVSETINDQTYKRILVRFNGEKAELQRELDNLINIEDNIQQDLLVLPYLINLHQVYSDAPIGQKHAIVREVFKEGLTYFKGVFRTPSINDGLTCNVLYLKEIGLLEIEQTYQIENSFSLCGE